MRDDAGSSSTIDAATPEVGTSVDGGSAGDTTSPDAMSPAAPVCTEHHFAWATTGGGPTQRDNVLGIAVDQAGDTWVTGSFIGTTTWGAFTLTVENTMQTSIFVAKLDPVGHVLLARVLQGDSGDFDKRGSEGDRIRLDANGDAYVAGTFEKQLDIDDVHLTEDDAGGEGAAFLVKLDGATGKAVWGAASANDGGNGEQGHDVAIDANGDVYLTGSYEGRAVFGGLEVTVVSGSSAAFVAKYSPASSSWVWAKGWGVSPDVEPGASGQAVSATADGYVYVSGPFYGVATIDGDILPESGGSFVAKIAANDGRLVWATEVASEGGINFATVAATAVDGDGDLYVTGIFDKGATMLPSSVDAGSPLEITTTALQTYASDPQDFFIGKFDAEGVPQWINHAGAYNGGLTSSQDVACDGQNVYVAGQGEGDTIFDGVEVPASGLFVAKYDASGEAQWVRGQGTFATDESFAAAVAASSTTSGVTIGGNYQGHDVSFGAINVIDQNDVFVAHLCN